jgi:hypothetical protein
VTTTYSCRAGAHGCGQMQQPEERGTFLPAPVSMEL